MSRALLSSYGMDFLDEDDDLLLGFVSEAAQKGRVVNGYQAKYVNRYYGTRLQNRELSDHLQIICNISANEEGTQELKSFDVHNIGSSVWKLSILNECTDEEKTYPGHVGNRETIFSLVKKSDACDGKSDNEIREDMMKLGFEVRRIAEENGYRFNSHHHDNEESGMPWIYDFYIEIADVDKDINRINGPFQLKMKQVLIQDEYGIYDEEKDRMIGFRTTIPWRIKKIYDEVSDTIEELESDGRIID